MEIILRAVDIISGLIVVVVGSRVSRMWFAVNATRNQTRNLLAALQRHYAEAIALPASLPKTFPAETQYVPLYDLPPELQRMISGHFRSLERDGEDIL